MAKQDNAPENDPTEPRWTCVNGHSNPANWDTCGMAGCGAAH